MTTLVFVLAIIGAIVVFLAVAAGSALLLASLLPGGDLQVKEREPELVPLVPAQTRKQRPDIWVN